MTTMTPTERIIAPILVDTYGTGGMVGALIAHLAHAIDTYAGEEDERGGREYMVMRVCWDWMTGGSTADAVAREIEDALAIAKDHGEGE